MENNTGRGEACKATGCSESCRVTARGESYSGSGSVARGALSRTYKSLTLPRLGQGTCFMGERAETAEAETAALLCGLSYGMNLIDTAEMYGDGASETLIGDLFRKKRATRSDVVLMTKVFPYNSSPPALFKSCENSLRRLGSDYLDYYLLHWRDGADLAETVLGMEELVRRGSVRRWGVSNFDVADMEELFGLPGGANCAVDQIMYHLASRGVEYDLLPWLETHGVNAVAYCPLAMGGGLRRTAPAFESCAELRGVAEKYGASIFQIMLAFTLRNAVVSAIPKASSAAHAAENARALKLATVIDAGDWAALDAAYPPPAYKMHLDME